MSTTDRPTNNEGTDMIDNDDRTAQFKEEIAEMGLRDPAAGRDRTLLRLGTALLVLGPVVGLVAYFIGSNTTNALQQRDAIVIAVIGMTLAVTGGALFLRYSLAGFLRFWLARLTYEAQAQTDRVVEATSASSTPRQPVSTRTAPHVAADVKADAKT